MERKTLPLRTSYINKTKMQLQCRVCLTQSSNVMFNLKDELELEAKTKTSYLEALRQVTSSKVRLFKLYPSNICPVCAALLKMALQLIRQYKATQIKLKEIFNYTSDELDEVVAKNEHSCEEKCVKPPVELIYKDKKFNVQEVVVVEDEKPSNCDYGGFLNNLGKEVTATFVTGLTQKKEFKDSDGIDMLSVAVKEKDRFVPVKELKIYQSSNQIEYTIEDSDFEIQSSDLKEDFEVVEDNVNIEYIDVDAEQDTLNNFIIDKSGKANNSETNNERAERLSGSLFKCDVCSKIYTTWRKLSMHRNRIHFAKQQTYTCEICGIFCKTKSVFNHHKLKHGEKKFACDRCGKRYWTKSQLRAHREARADRRQHLCQTCGAAFNYANALVYHLRLHTGEKGYRCEFCRRLFRMPGALVRHRRTHTDDRPYKCRRCEKRFRSSGELKSHELVHTGGRPFACPHCGRAFSKSHNMRVHALSHRGPHACRLCARGLVSAALMPLHLRVAHKGQRRTTEGDGRGSEEDGRVGQGSRRAEEGGERVEEGSEGVGEAVYYLEEGLVEEETVD